MSSFRLALLFAPLCVFTGFETSFTVSNQVVVATSIAQFFDKIDPFQNGNSSIGFVPTMGALHAGHLALIEKAKSENNIVVCSIFVNPTQFNNQGDLEKYPRTLDDDLKGLEAVGCDIAFCPTVPEMYPEGEDLGQYEYDFSHLENLMEGKYRPGHFRGVGIIVGKLFGMVKPNRAYFGEKDYQQVQIVKSLAKQGKFPVEIISCPTVRESDGLAMSSRNLRLSPAQREHASLVYQLLSMAKAKAGHASIKDIIKEVKTQIEEDPELQLDYFEIANAETLESIENWGDANSVVACIAVFAGEVRLIDNMTLIP